jgi:branched-chain amino acid transport system substrate-binding protein
MSTENDFVNLTAHTIISPPRISGVPMIAISRRSAVSAVVVSVLAMSLSGCNRVPDTIKIGVAQPLSGGLAALGKDLTNGVQLAIDELNKQGYKVNGKTVKLEMVAMDDKANVEEGKKVAQALVDEGVVAVIGHLNSGVSIPAAPIYAGKGIAQLAISSNPKFTELGFPTTLRIVANDALQARAVGSFAASQLEGTKFAVVDDGTAYGKDLAEAAAGQLKGKKTITIRESFDVVSTLNDFQVVALIDNLTKIDYNKQITILGTDTLKTTDMIAQSGNVGALYAASIVLEASEFPGGRAFLEAYQAAFKIPPAYGGHYTYDATYVLAKAIQNAGSADPKKITAALSAINGYGPVTGSMKWTDKGEQRYGVVSVYRVRAAKWESIMRSDNW